jgi:putative ABC transport system substrate-binding protein
VRINKQPKGRRTRWMAVALLILAGLLLAACQPTQPKTVTIGVVNLAPVLNPIFDGFKTGMTEMGYIEGEDVTYIYEGPVGSIDKLEPAIQSLLDSDVDLILSISTPATQAAQRVTAGTDMPVVFVPLTDPVAAGVVQSLSQPGGNITGVTFGASEARRLEWLLKTVPNVKRIYVPYNPDDESPVIALARVSEAASKLGVELVLREARNSDEITAAIEAIPDDVDAIFLLPDSLMVSRASDFVAATLDLNLPFAVPGDEEVEAGALISYSMNFHASGEQAARLADQILKGTKPADLPVETTEFFLVINLQTAEAIGLDIPDQILRQADTIIR